MAFQSVIFHTDTGLLIAVRQLYGLEDIEASNERLNQCGFKVVARPATLTHKRVKDYRLKNIVYSLFTGLIDLVSIFMILCLTLTARGSTDLTSIDNDRCQICRLESITA